MFKLCEFPGRAGRLPKGNLFYSKKEESMSIKKVLATIVGILFMLILFVLPGHAKVILKLQSGLPLALPVLGSNVNWIAEKVKEATNGEVLITVFEPGKIVGAMEILEAVSKGQIEAGYTPSGFWEGKMSGAAFFTAVPFGPEIPEYIAWMFHGNGLKLYQEMYDSAGYKVKVLPTTIMSAETSGWYRKKINSPADLKGLNIRFFGLGGKVMKKLGASVSLLPGSEIFPALERGAIDATEFSVPTVDTRMGFYKIAKYNYFPGWHQPSTINEVLINKTTWDKLSKAHQTLIEMVCMAAMTYSIAHSEGAQGKVIKENKEKHGVENIYWSKDMLDLFNKTWLEVAEEEAAKDAFFKKVWLDLKAFRAEYKSWLDLGFLPRK
jgi:TRAP-type mannitol/chloroaromatic compound transport system substrate-binding protein